MSSTRNDDMSRTKKLTEELERAGKVRVSIDPRDRRTIVRDLALTDDGESLLFEERKIERLRFLLLSNADGTQCETFWWDGFLATHQVMAAYLGIDVDQADSGFVDIVKNEWKFYDTDTNGYFYPDYVKEWIVGIIG